MEKKIENQEEAFEIIELATNDLESLTRAFRLIQEVCAIGNEANFPQDQEKSSPPILFH